MLETGGRYILVSGVGLIILSPMFLIVALLIWLEDSRNPFYVAPRVGQFCRAFGMVKFRSMTSNADRPGVRFTAAGDPRVIPMGKCIRRCKLDEFS